MALGVNIQWGYAGLFNAGVMGFAALGGVAVVLTSMPPVKGALAAGGWQPRPRRALRHPDPRRRALRPRAGAGLPARPGRAPDRARRLLPHAHLPRPGLRGDRGDRPRRRRLPRRPRPARPDRLGRRRRLRRRARPISSARSRSGLRSDYLAIATLGIAEIILAILKNENWLTRGVKNVTGLPRPIPDERVLQAAPWIARPRRAASAATSSPPPPSSRASATRCSSPPCSSPSSGSPSARCTRPGAG